MDRNTGSLWRLTGALAFALIAAVAGAAPSGGLLALTWTAPGRETAMLAWRPATCLEETGDRRQIELGMALFNAPGLLGGQAQRNRISCASCHANGRRSQWFQLDGISSGPGTADVSASFFGTARANAVFDPKPIPDLALPGKVDRSRESGKLEPFLDALIVDEFSGTRPSPRLLSALASYVRAVGPCSSRQTEPVSLAQDLELLKVTAESAALLAEQRDTAGAAILVDATRYRLGLIHERMAGPKLRRERAALLAASQEIASIGVDPARLHDWISNFAKVIAPRLRSAEPTSLYNAAQIERRYGKMSGG